MMCCNKCILNTDIKVDSTKFSIIQNKAINLLNCEHQFCKSFQTTDSKYSACSDCPQKYRLELCPQDAWVLTFLASNESFAIQTACYSLDTFVQNGKSELLCKLFKAANYEVRKELWLRMVEYYQDRMYLLDEIFEQNELAPAIGKVWVERRNEYQYSILQQAEL